MPSEDDKRWAIVNKQGVVTPHTECEDRWDSVDWDIYCNHSDNKGKTYIVCNTELPLCQKIDCPIKK